MNKIILTVLLATLCFFFKVNAQDNKAIDVTTKGIQIGQEVPDMTIAGLRNYKDKNGEPATTAKLSDFKGKLLILDFWATWCSPCVAMIPKMDSLQKQFGDKIQFLSVTYQAEREVMPFMEKFEKQKGKHYELPILTGDKALHKLFPHVYLPHYVWIDGDGIVKAITGYEEVKRSHIDEMLHGRFTLSRKQDFEIKYDGDRPFLIDGNGGNGQNLLYHSLLTAYSEGVPARFSYNEVDENGRKPRHITVQNTTIPVLYRFAFGGGKNFFGDNRLIYEVRDTTKLVNRQQGAELEAWIRENGYCYELIVPAYMGSKLFLIMQEELARLFPQYRASVEKRKIKCWTLVRTSGADKIQSKSVERVAELTAVGCNLKNVSIGHLIMKLNEFYMQTFPTPIVDGTEYKGAVDLSLSANMGDMAMLNMALQKYDLQFIEKDQQMEMIVIKDR